MNRLAATLVVLTLLTVHLTALAACGNENNQEPGWVSVQIENLTPAGTRWIIIAPSPTGGPDLVVHRTVARAGSDSFQLRVNEKARVIWAWGADDAANHSRAALHLATEGRANRYFCEAAEDEPVRWYSDPAAQPPREEAEGIPMRAIAIHNGVARVIATHPDLGYINREIADEAGAAFLEGIPTARLRTTELAAALDRQIMGIGRAEFFRSKPNPPASADPFLLGLKFSDPNTPAAPGIRIDEITHPHSLWGDLLPYVVGEHLISINGVQVFGIWDADTLLYEHAVTRGVEQPLHVQLENDAGEVFDVQATYRFDDAYFRARLTSGQATALAFSNTVWLGSDAAGVRVRRGIRGFLGAIFGPGEQAADVPAMTTAQEIFWTTQMRLVGLQLYPEAISRGQLLGFIYPSPVRIAAPFTKGVLKAATGSRTLARVGTNLAIGAVEGASAAHAERSPLAESGAHAQTVRDTAIAGGVIEVIVGSTARRMR